MSQKVINAIKEITLSDQMQQRAPQVSVSVLSSYLDTLECFSRLKRDPEYQTLLQLGARCLRLSEYNRGQQLCKQNEKGDRFFILLKGDVNVYVLQGEQSKKKMFSTLKKIEQVQKDILLYEGNEQLVKLYKIQLEKLTAQFESIQQLEQQDKELIDLSKDIEYKKHNSNFIIYLLKRVNNLKADDSFGDFSIARGAKRSASIIASSEKVIAAYMSFENYSSVFNFYIQNKEALAKRLISFFPRLDIVAANHLSYFFVEQTLLRKQILYNEGNPIQEIFFLEEGSIELTKEKEVDQEIEQDEDTGGIGNGLEMQSHKVKQVSVAILQEKQFFGYEQQEPDIHWLRATAQTSSTRVQLLSYSLMIQFACDYDFKKLISMKAEKSFKRYSERFDQINSAKIQLVKQASAPQPIESIQNKSPIKVTIPLANRIPQIREFNSSRDSSVRFIETPNESKSNASPRNNFKSGGSPRSNFSRQSFSPQISNRVNFQIEIQALKETPIELSKYGISQQTKKENVSFEQPQNQENTSTSKKEMNGISGKNMTIRSSIVKLNNDGFFVDTIAPHYQNDLQSPQKDFSQPIGKILDYNETFEDSKKRLQRKKVNMMKKKDQLPSFDTLTPMNLLQKQISSQIFPDSTDLALSPRKRKRHLEILNNKYPGTEEEDQNYYAVPQANSKIDHQIQPDVKNDQDQANNIDIYCGTIEPNIIPNDNQNANIVDNPIQLQDKLSEDSDQNQRKSVLSFSKQQSSLSIKKLSRAKSFIDEDYLLPEELSEFYHSKNSFDPDSLSISKYQSSPSSPSRRDDSISKKQNSSPFGNQPISSFQEFDSGIISPKIKKLPFQAFYTKSSLLRLSEVDCEEDQSKENQYQMEFQNIKKQAQQVQQVEESSTFNEIKNNQPQKGEEGLQKQNAIQSFRRSRIKVQEGAFLLSTPLVYSKNLQQQQHLPLEKQQQQQQQMNSRNQSPMKEIKEEKIHDSDLSNLDHQATDLNGLHPQNDSSSAQNINIKNRSFTLQQPKQNNLKSIQERSVSEEDRSSNNKILQQISHISPQQKSMDFQNTFVQLSTIQTSQLQQNSSPKMPKQFNNQMPANLSEQQNSTSKKKTIPLLPLSMLEGYKQHNLPNSAHRSVSSRKKQPLFPGSSKASLGDLFSHSSKIMPSLNMAQTILLSPSIIQNISFNPFIPQTYQVDLQEMTKGMVTPSGNNFQQNVPTTESTFLPLSMVQPSLSLLSREGSSSNNLKESNISLRSKLINSSSYQVQSPTHKNISNQNKIANTLSSNNSINGTNQIGQDTSQMQTSNNCVSQYNSSSKSQSNFFSSKKGKQVKGKTQLISGEFMHRPTLLNNKLTTPIQVQCISGRTDFQTSFNQLNQARSFCQIDPCLHPPNTFLTLMSSPFPLLPKPNNKGQSSNSFERIHAKIPSQNNQREKDSLPSSKSPSKSSMKKIVMN